MVGEDKMRITWITKDSSPATVNYGLSPGVNGYTSSGTTSSYSYLTYESGTIHDVVIGPLKPNTVYYYSCGVSSPEFSFKTPPAGFPIKFSVAGINLAFFFFFCLSNRILNIMISLNLNLANYY